MSKLTYEEGTISKFADNLIEQKFNADKPNQKWYTYVTEFNLRRKKFIYHQY